MISLYCVVCVHKPFNSSYVLSTVNITDSMDIKIILYFIYLMFSEVYTKRTKDMIYEPITGAAACFRRLNGTHQFGCSSGMSGNVGILIFISSEEDIQWIIEYGTRSPYIAVLNASIFDWDMIAALKNSGKVNGFLLMENNTHGNLEAFSHEDKCPNRYSGISSLSHQTCSNKTAWNPYGTSLMFYDLDLPMFYISDADSIEKIERCYKKHSVGIMDPDNVNALCALEMKTYMYAALNTETCYRRSNLITNFKSLKFCDPLGDQNVWYTLLPRCRHCVEQDGSIIMIATRLDSSSMFDSISPGAFSPVTGIVTLMATAALLSKKITDIPVSGRNIMFMMFQGESYDYIGSSRVLWDMKNHAFPFKVDESYSDQAPPLEMKHIGLYVELDQIWNGGVKEKEGTMYFYHSHLSSNTRNSKINTFFQTMNLFGKPNNIKLVDYATENIPPASLQTFLAENETFPGAVITGYKDRYTNRYYHSIFDNEENLGFVYYNGSLPPYDSVQAYIANVSATLASTLYSLLTNDINIPGFEADSKLVDELLYCYLESMDCSYFNASLYGQELMPTKPVYYVSVNAISNPTTIFTARTLAYLTGVEVNNVTQEECLADPKQQVYSYIWMNGNSSQNGICINTTVNFSIAVSPAFEIEGYDWASGNYSTWTESVWQELSMRLFLKPSKQHDILILSIGIVVLILSFSISYFAQSRGHILFGPRPSSRRAL